MAEVPEWLQKYEAETQYEPAEPETEICPVTETTTCTKDKQKQRGCSAC